MKTLITALLVGILLFAVSAGVSWYVVSQNAPTEEVAANDEQANDDPAEFPKPINESSKMEAMPVALRPEMPVTIEAVTELAQSIMKKEQALIDSESQLKKDEKRINLLFEDLKREREELSAFGQRIDARILQAREAVELLKMENQTLADQTKTLSTLEKKTGTNSNDAETDAIDRRVQTVKSWFKNLDAEQAAKYLKEFANRGDLEFSARLLDSLDDRQIAKILGVFNDAPLVAQIIDAYTKEKTRDDDQADAAKSPFRQELR